MKLNKIVAKIISGIVIIGILAGMSTAVYAGNSHLDVRASGISGVASKDPYSLAEAKDDSDQNFYIKLASLTGGPSLTFFSHKYTTNAQVSNGLTVSTTGVTKSHTYDIQSGIKGQKYYVYAQGPAYYGDVHGIGNYCP